MRLHAPITPPPSEAFNAGQVGISSITASACAHMSGTWSSPGLPGFDFFDTDALRPSEFRVVYSVMAPWAGREPADAFPFFAKVNLRNVVEQVRSRGFRVGLRPVDTAV